MSRPEARTEMTSPRVQLPRLDALDSNHQPAPRDDHAYASSSASSSDLDQGRFLPYHHQLPKSPEDVNRFSRSPSQPHHFPHGSASARLPSLPASSSKLSMHSGALPPLSSLTSSSSYGVPGPHPTSQIEGPSHFQHFQTRPSRSVSTSYVTGAADAFRPSAMSAQSHPRPSTSTSSPSGSDSVPRFPALGRSRSDWSLQHDQNQKRPHDAVHRHSPGGESVPGSSASSPTPNKRAAKAHVSSACLNCKRAHLACDSERPCRRCSKLGKTATCVDVQHRKRGRPRLRDREGFDNAPVEGAGPSSAAAQWHPGHREQPSFYPGAPAPLPSAGSRNRDWGGPPPLPEHPYHRQTPASPSRLEDEFHPQRPRSEISQVVVPNQAVRQTTLLCGNDFVVAHVSPEAYEVLGVHPSRIHRRSILDLFHTQDLHRFENTWRSLLEPVGLSQSYFPHLGMDVLKQGHTGQLDQPARGTIFLDQTVRIHGAPYFVRIHLGGGLGLDLFQPETLSRAYVVCSISSTEERLGPSRPVGQSVDVATTSWSQRSPNTDAHVPAPAPAPVGRSPYHATNDRVTALGKERYNSRPTTPQSHSPVTEESTPSAPTQAKGTGGARYTGLLARKMAAAAMSDQEEAKIKSEGAIADVYGPLLPERTLHASREPDRGGPSNSHLSAEEERHLSLARLRHHQQKGGFYEAHPSAEYLSLEQLGERPLEEYARSEDSSQGASTTSAQASSHSMIDQARALMPPPIAAELRKDRPEIDRPRPPPPPPPRTDIRSSTSSYGHSHGRY